MRNNQNRTGHGGPTQPAPAPTQSNLAYVVPTEFVELPSRGKFYPHNHPLHGQETIEIKYMTAKDEDILSSQALLKKGLAIDRLLENIIVVDVDPRELLVCDRNAIMIAARISSYGQEYNASTFCVGCNDFVQHEFDLTKSTMNEKCFDVQYLASEQVQYCEESSTFSVELPVSKSLVSFRVLYGTDEKTLSEMEEDKSVTSLLSSFIVSVNEHTNPELVASFVENMPAKDSKFLRDLYVTLVPAISLKQEFSCEKCFSVEEMEVPLTAEFFWPK